MLQSLMGLVPDSVHPTRGIIDAALTQNRRTHQLRAVFAAARKAANIGPPSSNSLPAL